MTTTTDSPMRAARLAKGWTLRDLENTLVVKTGVKASNGNLSRIERGEVAPGPALRKALCDTLDLRPGDLPERTT